MIKENLTVKIDKYNTRLLLVTLEAGKLWDIYKSDKVTVSINTKLQAGEVYRIETEWGDPLVGFLNDVGTAGPDNSPTDITITLSPTLEYPQKYNHNLSLRTQIKSIKKLAYDIPPNR